jgi:regulator of RNase E activity RraA
MPLCSAGATTRIGKVQIAGINVPIEVRGVTIWPGDVIVADEDGIVSIPTSLLKTVVERLSIIFEVERGMEDALKRDATVQKITAILAKKKPKK